MAFYQAQVAESRLIHAERRILVHMVEEIARHSGHADIIRELIDGTTGSFPGEE